MASSDALPAKPIVTPRNNGKDKHMYTFTYDSQGSHSYLVYQVKDTETIDSLSLGMITHNQIEGLLPTIYQQIDENQYLKYNISSRISLRQFFADTVNRKQFLGAVSGMTNVLLEVEEYMIDPNTLLLEMDYIFVDVSSCRAYMVCLPFIGASSPNERDGAPADINDKVSVFLKDILFRTQFDQSENLDYVAQIISFMNRPQAFSLPDFKGFLLQLAGDSTSQTTAQAAYAPAGAPQRSAPPAGAPQPNVPYTGAPPAGAPQPNVPYTGAPAAGPHQPGIPYTGAPPKAGFVTPQAPSGQRLQTPFNDAAGSRIPVTPPSSPVEEKPSRRNKKKSQQMSAQAPSPADLSAGAAPASSEKKMSFMYLMSHYSKENKAIYDAQKRQKSAPPETVASPGAMHVPIAEKATFPGKPEPPVAPGSPQVPFAIPGMKEEVPGPRQPYTTSPPISKQPPQPPATFPASASAQAQQSIPSPVSPSYPPQDMSQRQAYPPVPATGHSPAGPVSFGDTTSLVGAPLGGTTVLDAAVKQEPREICPYLIRQSNNERIPLSKPLFRIGKEKSFVDYFIGDNTAISRSHAQIIARGGQYFVIDTNSTNHTYVNGQMIQANHETELKHGDTLRLADESFEFRMS